MAKPVPSRSDKKKLVLAGGMILLAMGITAWYLLGGSGGATREDQAAQEQVLQKMHAQQPAEDGEGAAAPQATDEPAGRPRAVRPGK